MDSSDLFPVGNFFSTRHFFLERLKKRALAALQKINATKDPTDIITTYYL